MTSCKDCCVLAMKGVEITDLGLNLALLQMALCSHEYMKTCKRKLTIVHERSSEREDHHKHVYTEARAYEASLKTHMHETKTHCRETGVGQRGKKQEIERYRG